MAARLGINMGGAGVRRVEASVTSMASSLVVAADRSVGRSRRHHRICTDRQAPEPRRTTAAASAARPRCASSAAPRRCAPCCSAAPAGAASKSVSGRMQELRNAGQCALIPFIVAGDPDLGTTRQALEALDAGGADVIELGVPYSDPLADGPTIQAAATRALEKSVTLADVLATLKETSPSIKAPIVLFTYYNPILRMGLDAFCAAAKDAGASGLLVPDLPIEETNAIRCVSPTSIASVRFARSYSSDAKSIPPHAHAHARGPYLALVSAR